MTPQAMNEHERELLAELRKLREKAGLTQAEAAQALGASRDQITRIENSRVLGYDDLLVMLDLYKVPVDERGPYLELWERAWTPGRRVRPDRIGVRSVPRQGPDQAGELEAL
jgi:transcriptional regulator with XRE-family HTH domain